MMPSRPRRPLSPLLLAGAIIVACIAPPQPAWADDLVGRLRSGSGAAVPDVAVRLCSRATGSCGTAFTNATGYFRFSNVAAGQYTVEARPRSGTVRQTVSVPTRGVLTLTVR